MLGFLLSSSSIFLVRLVVGCYWFAGLKYQYLLMSAVLISKMAEL